jgi:hypothetical protein
MLVSGIFGGQAIRTIVAGPANSLSEPNQPSNECRREQQIQDFHGRSIEDR